LTDKIPVRFSHLLGYAGVGSIVRSEPYLYTVLDTSKWTEHTFLPYVERVRISLEIAQELHSPPIGQLGKNDHIEGTTIPGIRFPSWMRCRKCGLMHWQWWTKPHDQKIGTLCIECNKPLDQYPWVMIDSDGRMDDVPWHWLLHRGKECKEDKQNPHLFLFDNKTADLQPQSSIERAGANQAKQPSDHTSKRWTIKCSTCDLKAYIDERVAEHGSVRPTRHQPWLGRLLPSEATQSEPEVEVRMVEISDPRVYSVPPCTALVIPPESRVERGNVVDRLYCDWVLRDSLTGAKGGRALRIQRLANEMHCTRNDIEEALRDIERGYPCYQETFTPGQLVDDEYHALTTPIEDLRETEDFVPFHRTAQWNAFSEDIPDPELQSLVCLVDRLIEVKRLREIKVFAGFQRLGGELVPPDIVGEATWLPAIDMFGEGIFLSLAIPIVTAWESQPELAERIKTLQRRYEQSGLGAMKYGKSATLVVSSRLLLLHTLSHLLIRQLEISAGYPAASLKERIYCGNNMAGILIYVAVPDIAGSLGGLSELSKPDRFLGVLSAAMDKAEWCSLDPVCSEHEGQGPHLLNYAACHGCALIPEPSCLFGNELLDRTFVKGDASLGIAGITTFAKQPISRVKQTKQSDRGQPT